MNKNIFHYKHRSITVESYWVTHCFQPQNITRDSQQWHWLKGRMSYPVLIPLKSWYTGWDKQWQNAGCKVWLHGTDEMVRRRRDGKRQIPVMHVVGIPPTLESIKDSGLYLELLRDCWHYQEVTWFDLYLINLSLFLPLSRYSLHADPPLALQSLLILPPHCYAMWNTQPLSVTRSKKLIISGHSSISWVKKASGESPRTFLTFSNQNQNQFVKTEDVKCLLILEREQK